MEKEKDREKEKIGVRPTKLNEKKSDRELEREIKTKEILLLEEKHEQFVAVRKWEILAATKVKMSGSGKKKVNKGRDPFNQTFLKFRSKTQCIASVQPEKFRKNGSTFRGGPLFPVGPVGILVEWIAPKKTYDISSVKRVTRKFLEVSRCSRAKQRQRNVQKKVPCMCKAAFTD